MTCSHISVAAAAGQALLFEALSQASISSNRQRIAQREHNGLTLAENRPEMCEVKECLDVMLGARQVQDPSAHRLHVRVKSLDASVDYRGIVSSWSFSEEPKAPNANVEVQSPELGRESQETLSLGLSHQLGGSPGRVSAQTLLAAPLPRSTGFVHRRSVTQVPNPPRSAYRKHFRCRSDTDLKFDEEVGPVDFTKLLEILAQTAQSQPRISQDEFKAEFFNGSASPDEMLLEILQCLSFEDVVSLCVAAAKTNGLRLWMVAQLHFTTQLYGLMWNFSMAGMQAQAASETLVRVQGSFREQSSAREMFLEDVRLYELNQPRFELDLVTMFEAEQRANHCQQVALNMMQVAMNRWNEIADQKAVMERFVRSFTAKVGFVYSMEQASYERRTLGQAPCRLPELEQSKHDGAAKNWASQS